ncbi:Imm21 family immunity protein [Planosporangium sp. 12N6]|uniref:Imm21 family immunity protein n=1 Tax=Planosporangium spinosum TaxID=3402278 RepID=UPI003CF68E6F
MPDRHSESSDWGDYGRACAVDDWAGVIPVGPATALILGGDPLPTTYLPEHRMLAGAFAYDHGDGPLSEAVADLRPRVQWQEGPRWQIVEPLILFDSALRGTELVLDDHLRIEVEPGPVQTRTAYVEAYPRLVLVELALTP